jgi:2-(1,2-epoxy-1,2-dihydrophenyl)acetyl-CoA isomerase
MKPLECVEVERRGDAGWIRLNDPATLNALSARMVDELGAALAGHVEGGARVIVLTGAGRCFCSGANLSDLADTPSDELDAGRHLREHVNPLMHRLRACPVPILSAVRGAAAGVGCSIALASDIVIASDDAYFLQAFTGVGLIPDGGATYTLARSVGRARAMEMMLLGEKIGAAKALEWGLINYVAPESEFEPLVAAMAENLASRATAALGLTRRRVWAALDEDWAASLDAEAEGQSQMSKSEDFREGVAAFFARRRPQFKGR